MADNITVNLNTDRRGPAGPAGTFASHYDVTNSAYGAKGDVVELDDFDIIALDTTLTTGTPTFSGSDVGKLCVVWGAGAAGAPLVTTIASFNSATSVELTDAAATTVSDAYGWYGTDDSVAVQAAADAAANGGTVYFPAGKFACNFSLAGMVRCVGEGAPINGSSEVTPFNESSANTILFPADDSAPVILMRELRGGYVGRLKLSGNGLGVSVAGLSVQSISGDSTWPGMGLVVEQVSSRRFTAGFRFASPNMIELRTCSAIMNQYGFHGVELSDTWRLVNCSGSGNSTAAIQVANPRGVFVSGGDWGFFGSSSNFPSYGDGDTRILNATGGGTITWSGGNFEATYSDALIELGNVQLNISGVRWGNTSSATPAFIRQKSANYPVAIGPVWFNSLDSYAETSTPLLWEGGDETMRGPYVYGGTSGTLRWATDTTFATEQRVDIVRDAASTDIHSRRIELRDDFIAGGTTSPNIASLGWTIQAFQGSLTPSVDDVANTSTEMGRFQLNTSGTAGDGGWIHLGSGKAAWGTLNNQPWEMVWRIRLDTVSGTQAWIGLLGGSVQATPAEFIGMKREDSGDTNWMLTCGSSSTYTETDSGVAVGNTLVTLFLKVLADGTIRMRVNETGVEKTITTNIPTGTLYPGVSVEAIGSSARRVDLDLFALEMESNR